jgi:hypothetical protein
MRIAVIGFAELAEATKCIGEETAEPGDGELTVTPANADTADTTSNASRI